MFEWSCDRTLLVVAAYIKVAVVTVIEKLVDKCRIAVECKYDRLVLCEQCVKSASEVRVGALTVAEA